MVCLHAAGAQRRMSAPAPHLPRRNCIRVGHHRDDGLCPTWQLRAANCPTNDECHPLVFVHDAPDAVGVGPRRLHDDSAETGRALTWRVPAVGGTLLRAGRRVPCAQHVPRRPLAPLLPFMSGLAALPLRRLVLGHTERAYLLDGRSALPLYDPSLSLDGPFLHGPPPSTAARPVFCVLLGTVLRPRLTALAFTNNHSRCDAGLLPDVRCVPPSTATLWASTIGHIELKSAFLPATAQRRRTHKHAAEATGREACCGSRIPQGRLAGGTVRAIKDWTAAGETGPRDGLDGRAPRHAVADRVGTLGLITT